VGAIAVDEGKEITVILSSLLFKFVFVCVTQSFEEVLHYHHWLFIGLQMPLWKQKKKKKRKYGGKIKPFHE